MKTNLKENIWINGFDHDFKTHQFWFSKKTEIKEVIYLGKTSEIPEEIARECFELQQVFNTPEYLAMDIDRYRNYQVTEYIWFDCTLKQSIQSACNQEYCIIYKL